MRTPDTEKPPAAVAAARGVNAEFTPSDSGSPEPTATADIPTSVYDVIASLDRLAAALADERRAFEDGFKAGYADGYSVGCVHGERAADETWSWALGALGVGKRDPNPDRRAADRWRLLAGHGPAPKGGDQ